MARKSVKAVIVRWLDACKVEGDFEEDQDCHAVELISAGILKKNTKDRVEIAVDHNPEDNDYRDVATIPKKNIQSLVIVEVGVWPRKK